jgi:hypothetical protein
MQLLNAVQVWGGTKLATLKLHLASCHLPDEARLCGATSLSLEFWIERMVQQYKAYVKGRSTWCPALVFWDEYLLRRTFAAFRCDPQYEGHCRPLSDEHQGFQIHGPI